MATPDIEPCTSAPPSSSWVTRRPVTDSTTSGPVRYIRAVSRTMNTKSASAGEYAAPPAHGPRITLICGMTPEASTCRRKIPP